MKKLTKSSVSIQRFCVLRDKNAFKGVRGRWNSERIFDELLQHFATDEALRFPISRWFNRLVLVLFCESFERVRKADDVMNEMCAQKKKRLSQFFRLTRLSHYSNRVRMGISNKLNFKSVFKLRRCFECKDTKQKHRLMTLSAFKISRPWHHNWLHLVALCNYKEIEITFIIFSEFLFSCRCVEAIDGNHWDSEVNDEMNKNPVLHATGHDVSYWLYCRLQKIYCW